MLAKRKPCARNSATRVVPNRTDEGLKIANN